MSQQKKKAQCTSIGFISRFDYGAPGCINGLIKCVPDIYANENIVEIIWIGGLISHNATDQRIKEQKKLHKGEDISANEIQDMTLRAIARELKDIIPVFTNSITGKIVPIKVITSPIKKYDGIFGETVLFYLNEYRSDIIPCGSGHGRFRITMPRDMPDCVIEALVPSVSQFGSQYNSATADNQYWNRIKASVKPMGDIYVVGCGGSAYMKPQKEFPRPIETVPSLSKTESANKYENQVGIKWINLPHVLGAPYTDNTYSLKDLTTSFSVQSIKIPEGIPVKQSKILNLLVKEPLSAGVIAHTLNFQNKTVHQTLAKYIKDGHEPPVVLDDVTGTYAIDPIWCQKKLTFKLPKNEDLVVTKFLSSACLHAGYRSAQYDFLKNDVPDAIIEHDVQHYVVAGDLIAGMKHDLERRGELIDRSNYTNQEELAGWFLGNNIIDVFKRRYDNWTKYGKKKESLQSIVEQCLLNLHFITGNHDQWVKELGFTPLELFTFYIKRFVQVQLLEFLASRHEINYDTHNFIKTAVSNCIRHEDKFSFDDNIKNEQIHPHQGRMTTSSGRAQQALKKIKDANVIHVGNYHTATIVLEWTPELGQRLAIQHGTLASHTEFEQNKTKICDTGMWILAVYSYKGRIIKTATTFIAPKTTTYDISKELYDEFLEDSKL